METTMTTWTPFPYPQTDYNYNDNSLEKNWSKLHAGDGEPFPSANYFESLCAKHPKVADSIPNFDGDYQKLADTVQEAWRLFHKGNFQQATEMGLSVGIPGYAAANKATYVHTTYIETDKDTQLELYQSIVERADKAAEAMPTHANSQYFSASALGRYSQLISIAKAITEGLAGKVKKLLDNSVKLDPKNAEAHIALALYHAEIIDKMGSMVAKLTFGAKKDDSIWHFEQALEIAPNAPIVYIEYANGLLMLFGKKKIQEATEAYEKAASMEPIEAMQKFDIELAKEELE